MFKKLGRLFGKRNTCNNCHQDLEPDARYCRFCGAKRGKKQFIPKRMGKSSTIYLVVNVNDLKDDLKDDLPLYRVILTDVHQPELQYKKFFDEVWRTVLTIGCDSGCGIRIVHDPSVSGEHCRLRRDGDKFYIINLSPSNVTELNGVRVEGEALVSDRDLIKIGNVEMRVEITGPLPPPRVILTDIHQPEHRYEKYLIESLVIGYRSTAGADIVIDWDKSVSGKHCELLLEDEEVYIVNHSHANGTFVNGVRITSKTPIYDGSIIKMGWVEMRIEIDMIDIDT